MYTLEKLKIYVIKNNQPCVLTLREPLLTFGEPLSPVCFLVNPPLRIFFPVIFRGNVREGEEREQHLCV